jgi:hypothetical protein
VPASLSADAIWIGAERGSGVHMSSRAPSEEILVVGMSRSGTTVIADILRTANNVHIEMEPHLIWKAGDFNHLDDEDHTRDEGAYRWIRARLTGEAVGRTLIEKSPPNCLRPHTVHRVFPTARILYVAREPGACLYSNYTKSIARHALSPRVAIRKYMLPRRSEAHDARFGSDRKAVGGRTLWNQLRKNDTRSFLRYSVDLWQFRQRAGSLPFGPKLSGFEDIVRDVGLLGYHAQCMTTAAEKASVFRELYGGSMRIVSLEELVANPDVVIRRVLDFVGCDIPTHELNHVIGGLQERQERTSVPPEFAERLALVATPQWEAQVAASLAACHN